MSVHFVSAMKIFSVLAFVVLPSISAFAPVLGVARNYKKPSTSAIFSVADLKVSFEKNLRKTFLLDIRELDEWTEAHLAWATPSPLSKLSAGKWMDNKTGVYYPGTFPIDRFTSVAINTNTKIWVHCKNGGEGTKEAVELLKQMGYLEVVALKETFDELAEAEICDITRGEILQDLTDFA